MVKPGYWRVLIPECMWTWEFLKNVPQFVDNGRRKENTEASGLTKLSINCQSISHGSLCIFSHMTELLLKENAYILLLFSGLNRFQVLQPQIASGDLLIGGTN